jgi:FkbM family methyltransferase
MVVALTVVEEAAGAIGHGAGSVIVPDLTVGRGFWVEVRALEPSAECAGYRRLNLARNGRDDRVTVIERAVVGRGSRQTQNPIGMEIGMADTTEPDGESVDVMSFAEAMSSIDLLKMDCEGGEYDIVASASSAMLHRIQRLALAYHPAPPEQAARRLSAHTEAGLVGRWRQDVIPGDLGVVSFGRDIA